MIRVIITTEITPKRIIPIPMGQRFSLSIIAPRAIRKTPPITAAQDTVRVAALKLKIPPGLFILTTS